MMLKITGELDTRTPTPKATIRMWITSATCWPRIPQMERRKPELSELLMVKMAPAPGVKLIRMPAPTKASQRENCTVSAYAGEEGGRDRVARLGSLWVPVASRPTFMPVAAECTQKRLIS